MIIKDEEILKNELKNESNIKLINFIPTMGNLHEGHLSLLRFAKKNNHLSVVSIFVNPLQFDDTNDFKSYPKTLKKDLNLLNKLKADIIGRGGAWLDTGSIEDFYKTSAFVSSLENRQGLKIACLEEIALSNKWIKKVDINKSIKFYGKCDYSNYLKNLI